MVRLEARTREVGRLESALARHARRLRRGVRRARALARDAAFLVRSGAFDKEWFETEVGRTFHTVHGAAAAFLRTPGRPSPHPLFEYRHWDPARTRGGVLDYLADPWSATSPHPLFDVDVAREQLAGSTGPAGAGWAGWVAGATADTPVPVPAGIEPIRWGELRPLLVAMAAARRRNGSRPPTPGDWRVALDRPRVSARISIVAPFDEEVVVLLRRLQAWAIPAGQDWELVLHGVASRPQAAVLRARFRDLPLVLVAGRANNAILASTGDTVLLVRKDAELDPLAPSRLQAALTDQRIAVVQPLNLRPDSTVASAGGWYPPGRHTLWPLLAEHPAEDAERLGGARLAAPHSAVVALRATTLLKLEGLDTRLRAPAAVVDLALRARRDGLGETRLAPAARVVDRMPARRVALALADLSERWPPTESDDLLAGLGFSVSDEPAGEQERPALSRRPLSVVEGRPRLRWAIDIAAPAGPLGAAWGDRHFARSLAAALERLGQYATVDHREARGRSTRAFDDVILVLRGLDEVQPPPGAVNLMWLISHPDDVGPQELARYDAVFAASPRWAAERSRDWGIDIRPLLQCTDPELFNPGRATPDTGPRLLFVGNLHGVGRPAIEAAVAADTPVRIYGRGWEAAVPAGWVAASGVPNTEVGALYAAAGVVLNDHFPDMLRQGFLSNRLFDAVACGARVLSDRIDGLDEVFGGAVRSYADPTEFKELVRAAPEHGFPDRATRLALAHRMAAEHSFEARANELLTAALRLRTMAAVD